MSGFDNDTVYANNADFSRAGAGGGQASNGLQLNGQLWIGTTNVNPGGTHVTVGYITSAGGSLTVSNNSGGIDLSVAGGTTTIQTLTGNSGGALSPTAGNISTLGTGSITISGGGSTLTTQLTGLTNHAVLVGAGTATITKVGPTATSGQVFQSAGAAADPVFSTATYPAVATGAGTILRADGTNWVATTATYPATTTINQVLYSSANNVIAGITAANNGTMISGTTGIPSWLANGTTGQLLTATTGSPPSWVSPATSGTVTTVSVVSANGFAGTVANATTTPAITLTTTITGVLSGNGTAISGSTVTNHATLIGGASNAITSILQGAGQLLIGTTASDPSAATLTAGTGVAINSASGAITINAVGSGLTWTVITANTSGAVNNGYIANKAGTATISLPTTSAVGDVISVTGINTATGWQLTQAAGQQIFFGTSSTTSGATGTLTSSAIRDSVTIVCVVANLTWNVLSSIGNLTVV